MLIISVFEALYLEGLAALDSAVLESALKLLGDESSVMCTAHSWWQSSCEAKLFLFP